MIIDCVEEHRSSSVSVPLLVSSTSMIGVDEMLVRFAGEFGKWQRRHFVLTSLAWALNAFHTMVVVFADRDPLAADRRPESSTISQWGLVGDDKYKLGLARSAFFLGAMLGAGFFGSLSDSFLGRKGTLTVTCSLNAAFGFLTAFSPSFPFYAALRLLTGFSTGGVGLTAFVLTTEPVGPSKRGAISMSTFYFFSFGTIALAIAALFLTSWRSLYVATSVPSLLFVLAVIPFIEESPRWHLVHRNPSAAMRIMRSIAETNGRHIPDNISLSLDCIVVQDQNRPRSKPDKTFGLDNPPLLRTILQVQHDLQQEVQEVSVACSYPPGPAHNKHQGTTKISSVLDNPTLRAGSPTSSILDVVKSPSTRTRLALTLAINLLISIVYYGLTLNVANLSTDLHVSVILNAAAEMPAYALTAALVKGCGRRPMVVLMTWISAVFCIAGAAAGTGAVRTACGVVGIFAVTATFNLLFIYTAELFPTAVRNAALGCVTQAGQTGAIVAPMVVVLGGGWPLAVFGACGMVAGLMGLSLPETLDRPLYDTMEGMEKGESKEKDDALVVVTMDEKENIAHVRACVDLIC